MRFKYVLKPKQVIIEAIPESDSEWIGYRAESPYPGIRLIKPHLVFFAEIKNIHPDMLALLCIVTFYPFCRSSITLPEPVSERFAQAIESLGIYDMIDGKYVRIMDHFTVTNINPKLLPYTSNSTNRALAYGGGLDSTATICLFPELYIIHESRLQVKDSLRESNSLAKRGLADSTATSPKYQDVTPEFMQDLEKGWTKWKGKTFSIGSNNKDLCEPNGWSAWISCTATSILLATDLSLNAILLGSSIGSSNIKNGEIYINPSPNMWFSLFKQAGLPVFSPIAGLTEISLGKIIYRTYPKWLNKITFCIKDNGHNCYKCWKCFRRQVIINYLLHGTNKQRYSIDWDSYNRPAIVNNLKSLAERGGPSLQWALINSLGELPDWVTQFVIPHKDTFMKLESWIDKHHPQALNIPSEYDSWIKGRISKFID